MNSLAKKIAHLLAENANKAFYEDEVRYGLEIALGALFQIAVIMLAAILIGVGQEVLAVIIAAALYRRYSGGPHCKTYFRCTITSMLTFVILGSLVKYIPTYYLPIYIICLTMLSILVIRQFVPVDNPIHIIEDQAIRKKRKQQSYLILFLLLVFIIITGYLLEQKVIATALLLGLLWQNFALLPWGHALIRLWNQLFEKIEQAIRGEEVTKC